jgi:hypothetical protein
MLILTVAKRLLLTGIALSLLATCALWASAVVCNQVILHRIDPNAFYSESGAFKH